MKKTKWGIFLIIILCLVAIAVVAWLLYVLFDISLGSSSSFLAAGIMLTSFFGAYRKEKEERVGAEETKQSEINNLSKERLQDKKALAGEILEAFDSAKNSIYNIANPAVSDMEREEADIADEVSEKGKSLSQEEKEAVKNWYIYSQRFDKNLNNLNNLKSLQYKAKIYFEEDLHKCFAEIDKIVLEIGKNIFMLSTGERGYTKNNKNIQHVNEIWKFHPQGGDGNKVEKIVKEAEGCLLKYLQN